MAVATSPTSPTSQADTGFDAFAARLAEHLDAGDASRWRPTDPIADRIDWDSLAHAEVAEWLTGDGVRFPDGLLEELLTLGDLHHYATSPATQVASPTARPGARSPDLVAIGPADHAAIYQLFTAGQHLTRYRLRGQTPSPEVFHRQLWDRVLVQFAVRAGGRGPLLGVVTAFDPDLRNRHVHVAAVADPSVVGHGTVARATVDLVDHLFTEFDLRKVYAEALAGNLTGFASGAGRWFEVEGRLHDHEFVDGGYEDVVLISTTRSAWEARRPS